MALVHGSSAILVNRNRNAATLFGSSIYNIDIYHIIVIEITMGRPTYSHLGDRSDLIIRFEAFIRSLPTLFLFLRFVYWSWINFSTKILQYSKNYREIVPSGYKKVYFGC